MVSERAQRIPPAAAYIGCIVMERVFSFITVPLMAAYITPARYGQYDLAISVIDFFGLITALGLADCVVRFATTASSQASQRTVLAEFLGVGIVATATVAIAAQLALPYLADALHIKLGLFALRCSVMALSFTSIVDTALCWIRFKKRSDLYFLYVATRSAVFALMTCTMLVLGYGVEGIMIGNAVLLMVLSLVAGWIVIRDAGVIWKPARLKQLLLYGAPLVGGGLMMFVLGSCNRWFLPGHVTDSDIAYLGIASRFATFVALAFAPFALWWGPQRISALFEHNGRERTASVWGYGFAALVVGAVGVSLTGPLFIEFVLPPSYRPAIGYLPALAMLQVVTGTCSLSNSSAYAMRTGTTAFLIDLAGVATAITGFFVLVPAYGVAGAIASTALGHTVRLAIYMAHGIVVSGISYPLKPALLLFVIAALFVLLAPQPSTHVAIRIAWATLAIAVIALAVVRSGLASGLVEVARLRATITEALKLTFRLA